MAAKGAENEDTGDEVRNIPNGNFTVPKNLYIIGTMNTADRSVEALDTALRRRFSFEEMMPNPELLNDKEVVVGGEKFSLNNILEKINERIEVLKDRDHLIGHSYFMGVSEPSQLTDVFFDKIIPLLQEYFYGDYEKILMVLGDGFVEKKPVGNKVFFGSDSNYDNFEMPSHIYHIRAKGEIGLKSALLKLMNESQQPGSSSATLALSPEVEDANTDSDNAQ